MKEVERYINEIIKGKGEYSTIYHHSENLKKYGRLFAYPSIQSLSCNVRGFLFYNSTDHGILHPDSFFQGFFTESTY